MCSPKELECVDSVDVDAPHCLKPCSGLIVTSFSKDDNKKNLDTLVLTTKAYDKYKKIALHPIGSAGEQFFYL